MSAFKKDNTASDRIEGFRWEGGSKRMFFVGNKERSMKKTLLRCCRCLHPEPSMNASAKVTLSKKKGVDKG